MTLTGYVNPAGSSVRQLAQRYLGTSTDEGRTASSTLFSEDAAAPVQQSDGLPPSPAPSQSVLASQISGAGLTLAEARALVATEATAAAAILGPEPSSSPTGYLVSQAQNTQPAERARLTPFKRAVRSIHPARPGSAHVVPLPACNEMSGIVYVTASSAAEAEMPSRAGESAVRRLLGGKARLRHQPPFEGAEAEEHASVTRDVAGSATAVQHAAILPRASKV